MKEEGPGRMDYLESEYDKESKSYKALIRNANIFEMTLTEKFEDLTCQKL